MIWWKLRPDVKFNQFRHRYPHNLSAKKVFLFLCSIHTPLSQTFSPQQINPLLSHLAAWAILLDLLASKRNSGFSGRSSTRLVFHSGLDLACHCQESLFDIGRCLRRSLQEFNSKSISKLLTLFRRNDTLSLEIALITHKEFVHVFACIPVNFMKPLLDIIEGFIVSHVINDNDTVSPSVVGWGDGTEALLSSSVPNLELDCLSVKLNCADFLWIRQRKIWTTVKDCVSRCNDKQEKYNIWQWGVGGGGLHLESAPQFIQTSCSKDEKWWPQHFNLHCRTHSWTSTLNLGPSPGITECITLTPLPHKLPQLLRIMDLILYQLTKSTPIVEI